MNFYYIIHPAASASPSKDTLQFNSRFCESSVPAYELPLVKGCTGRFNKESHNLAKILVHNTYVNVLNLLNNVLLKILLRKSSSSFHFFKFP